MAKQPKRINPANIRIGDLVRVTWKTGDIERSVLAEVAARDYEGSVRVFYSNDKQEIFRWIPGINTYKVTLIKASARLADTPLSLFQELEYV